MKLACVGEAQDIRQNRGTPLLLLLFIFLKPLILQQLFRCRPIPPTHHHDSPNELLIFRAGFSLRRPGEWCCLRLWNLLHEVQNSCDDLWARNFFVFRGERTKVSELPLEDLQSVCFVAVRNGAGTENVEGAAVDKAYKLQVRRAGSALSVSFLS